MPGRLIMLCPLARHLVPKLARDSHYSSQAIKQEGQAHPPGFLAVFVDDGCIWFYVFCCVWYKHGLDFIHKFDNWQLTADQSAFECQYDMSTSFASIHKITWVTCSCFVVSIKTCTWWRKTYSGLFLYYFYNCLDSRVIVGEVCRRSC